LWVPPNTGSSPSVQPTIKSDFAKPRLSVATETPSERPRVDHTPPNPPNLIRTRRPTALPKSYLHAIDSNPGNSLVTSPVQPAIKSDFAKPRPSVATETPSERPRVDQTPLNPPNLLRTRRPTVSSVQELPNTFSSAVSISRP
jgi:hypothetical protein